MVDAPSDDAESLRSSKFTSDAESLRSSKFTSDDNESIQSSSASEMDSYLLKKHRAKPGSYVIKVPKDQIYRVPPPENAKLFESYTRRATRPRRPCRCVVWAVGVVALVIVALAATAGIIYVVSRPELPSYMLDRLAIRGLEINNSSPIVLSPEFDATIRADNPNKRIGIQYRDGSSVSIAYGNVAFASGAWPTFYQGARNVTVFRTALKGSGVRLSSEIREALQEQHTRGEVPMVIDVKVHVRVKFGSITSWTFKVKVKCDIVVDKLTTNSKLVSKSCKANADFF